jgi:hypothetical protein
VSFLGLVGLVPVGTGCGLGADGHSAAWHAGRHLLFGLGWVVLSVGRIILFLGCFWLTVSFLGLVGLVPVGTGCGLGADRHSAAWHAGRHLLFGLGWVLELRYLA